MDLQLFPCSQIHKAFTSLCLQNEVQLFLAILGKIYGPVGIVRTNRSINLESVWDFEEHFHIRIIVQRKGKRFLYRTAVIHDIIVNTVIDCDSIMIQVGNQFVGIKDFLNLVFLAIKLNIADSRNCQSMTIIAN